DRVPDVLERLEHLAADPHPRVRLEAIRAASFFTSIDAVQIVLASTGLPADRYLEYTRTETLKALEPYVRKAISSGQTIPLRTPAVARFFLKSLNTEDLLRLHREPAVYRELLFRKGMRDEVRRDALAGLAHLQGSSEVQVLLDAVRTQDQEEDSQEAPVIFD